MSYIQDLLRKKNDERVAQNSAELKAQREYEKQTAGIGSTNTGIAKEQTGAYARYLQSQNEAKKPATTYSDLSTQSMINEKLDMRDKGIMNPVQTQTKTEPAVTGNSYDFAPSQTYLKAMEYTNQLLAQLSSGRTSYTDKLNDIMNQISNREEFAYDFNTDPLFQQRLESAMQSGKLAMQDTMGQTAQLTGGYGSSYGTAVANQAYNQSIQGAYNDLPEYYGLAYDKYNDETNRMLAELAMYQSADETEYNRLANAYAANNTAAAKLYDMESDNFWKGKEYEQKALEKLANGSAGSEVSYLGNAEFNALKSELQDAMKNTYSDSDTINQMLATYASKYGWDADSPELQQLINYVDGLQPANQYSIMVAPNGNPMYKDQYGRPYQGSQTSIGFTIDKVGKNGKATDSDAIYKDEHGNTLTYAEIVQRGWKGYITKKK